MTDDGIRHFDTKRKPIFFYDVLSTHVTFTSNGVVTSVVPLEPHAHGRSSPYRPDVTYGTVSVIGGIKISRCNILIPRGTRKTYS